MLLLVTCIFVVLSFELSGKKCGGVRVSLSRTSSSSAEAFGFATLGAEDLGFRA